MRITENILRELIYKTLLEGDALLFPQVHGDQLQSEPDDGEEAVILDFPHKEPPSPETAIPRREREFAAERDMPGVPAEIPTGMIETDRQTRVEYAAYVIGRVAKLVSTLAKIYDKDVILMQLDPRWRPYAPKTDTPVKRKKTEQFNPAVMAIVFPGIFSTLTRTRSAEVGIYEQIDALMPIMDKSDQEESLLYNHLMSAQNVLGLIEGLVNTPIPPKTSLNEFALRTRIRMILEGDVIDVDTGRFKSEPRGVRGTKADVVQLPGRSVEDMFQKQRPRHMVLYDIARQILDDPDAQKMLKVRAVFENNPYTKTMDAHVYVGNKLYEITGARMKALGVNPYAKPVG